MSFISHLFGSTALTASVGKDLPNTNASDIRTTRALLNAYRRTKKQPALPTVNKVDEALTSAIEDFQKEKLHSNKPDGRIDPGGKTIKGLLDSLRAGYTTLSVTPPVTGMLTWDAEGHEGGLHHSRRLHVPGDSSGLTLGRGYDMRQRTISEILMDLVNAGVASDQARKICTGAGKWGFSASAAVIDNDLLDFEITPQNQLKLFEKVYAEHLADVKRISNDPFNINKYGRVDWAKLDYRILDILVDLRYRGDYRKSKMDILQPHVANNDYVKFKAEITKENNWPDVIQNARERFKQRVEYVRTAPPKA